MCFASGDFVGEVLKVWIFSGNEVVNKSCDHNSLELFSSIGVVFVFYRDLMELHPLKWNADFSALNYDFDIFAFLFFSTFS